VEGILTSEGQKAIYIMERSPLRLPRGRGGRGRGVQLPPGNSGLPPAECKPGQNVVISNEDRGVLATVVKAWDGAFFHVSFRGHGSDREDQVWRPPPVPGPLCRLILVPKYATSVLALCHATNQRGISP